MSSWPQSQRRMVEMLTFRLLQTEARNEATEWSTGITRIQQSPYLRQEFESLSTALLDRVRVHAEERPIFQDSPVFLHRQYTRDEILVGLGLKSLVGKFQAQTGWVWIDELNSGLLFVTLDKSEKTFSPTTRYEDFALSSSQFHWQSQSTTGENSPTGQRYVHQQENGAKFLLFVRPTKNDAFVFLGPVKYLSHSGSRPMSIYWQLENPMPAWFFEICASLRVA